MIDPDKAERGSLSFLAGFAATTTELGGRYILPGSKAAELIGAWELSCTGEAGWPTALVDGCVSVLAWLSACCRR